MISFDFSLFDALTAKAKASARQRQHFNLHTAPEEPSQRLLIALEPETYVRPHRHLADAKPECFLCLRGRLGLLLFDDHGVVTKAAYISPGSAICGGEIPTGVRHAVLSLESGSILFETKQGPFVPLAADDFAPWSPPEGDSEVAGYLQVLKQALSASSQALPS